MQMQAKVTDEFEVTVDVPPGGLIPSKVILQFDVHTREELRTAIDTLGFDPLRLDPYARTQYRFRLPLTIDGEAAGATQVHLWLGDELAQVQAAPAIVALKDLVLEAQQEEHADATA